MPTYAPEYEEAPCPMTVEELLQTDQWNLQKLNAEDYLSEFCRQAWHVLEPGREFKTNWHLDATCEHLEAITNGEIQNLIINMPPRCTKSLTVAVFWPMWSWIKQPELRWLFSSYFMGLSIRDSLKCRRLIESTWFRTRWGNAFKITSDQNAKQRFENNHMGYRLSTSVDGSGTGEGGDVLVVDDAHNAKEAQSTTKLDSVQNWWKETFSSRLNDVKTGKRVVVMQRLHERDLTGHLLSQAEDADAEQWVHLRLPMRYEKKFHCATEIGWEDPRVEEGQLLWPERFNEKAVRKQEIAFGIYGTAGQYQQHPAPRGGGMIQESWFQFVDANEVPKHGVDARFWDMASTGVSATNTDPDYTAGAKGRMTKNGLYVMDMQRHRLPPALNKNKLEMIAEMDGKKVKIFEEQEPGSSGKAVISDHALTIFKGFVYKGIKSTGDKPTRAEPFASAAENGNVYLVRGDWNRAFIDECLSFPNGAHEDQVDAVSGLYTELSKKKTHQTSSMRH